MINKEYILIDLYGVIIEESKGFFIPYTYQHFPESEYERITKAFREDKIFGKAQAGKLSNHEFLAQLGFDDPEASMKDYLENYLTLDPGFKSFAEKTCSKYKLVLLSNDVSEWSGYLTDLHGINSYFTDKIVSGDVGLKKPDPGIFELTISRLGCHAEDCVFIDNSVKNLNAASGLGIKTILFNRDSETYDGTTVNDFEELAQLLKDR
ncbi:MAG: HAD-IA family hydrolase [Clostridiales bacterium]|nr:HAD-IA family hydrolase [Clostridiales bacterium]